MAKMTLEIPVGKHQIHNLSTDKRYEIQSDSPSEYKPDDYIEVTDKDLIECIAYGMQDERITDKFVKDLMDVLIGEEGINDGTLGIILKVALKKAMSISTGSVKTILKAALESWNECGGKDW